jgi:hypothetical protein
MKFIYLNKNVRLSGRVANLGSVFKDVLKLWNVGGYMTMKKGT